MASLSFEPFWLCEWRDVVFLHLEADPEMLQQVVPFELDRFQGRAFVSLVSFTLKNMRPRWGGALSRALFKPFGTHCFLNIRTYVRHGRAPGIYFLKEYLNAPWLNHLAGPLLYGLPFHLGRLEYQQARTNHHLTGTVVGEGGGLHYEGWRANSPPDRLDSFLLERYRAFTQRNGHQAWFPVWHKPWPYQGVHALLHDTSLLRSTGNWARSANLISAHWSPGFDEVWMGWRHPLEAKRENCLG